MIKLTGITVLFSLPDTETMPGYGSELAKNFMPINGRFLNIVKWYK